MRAAVKREILERQVWREIAATGAVMEDSPERISATVLSLMQGNSVP
jgi:hypothetical protein